MKVFRDIRKLRNVKKPVFLAAGFFDGMHLGHRRLIDSALQAATRSQGEAWLLTFEDHPKKSIKPADAPKLLTSTRHRLMLMNSCGLDGCLLIEFDRRFADMSAEHFVHTLKINCPTLAGIFIGENWRFGRQGKGDIALLKSLGDKLGFDVCPVKPALYAQKPISSTRIRESVKDARLSDARKMLGRPFSVLGTVIRGRQVGKMLGYPTANLSTCNEIMPPIGVYAVMVRIGNRIFQGVMNHGFRPTFPDAASRTPISEIHILSKHTPRLYNRELEVFIVKKIRNEHKFTSITELSSRIAKDILAVKKYIPKSACHLIHFPCKKAK